ncbi:MAG: penicillin-binding protein 2 [Bacteroidota bacterium]
MNLLKNRRFTFYFMFSLLGLIFLVRIFSLQVLDEGNYKKAVNNALKKITIYPSRGIIYDRHGNLLVYNGPVYDLIVFPGALKGLDTAGICALLRMDRKEFDKRLEQARVKAKTQRRRDNSFNRSATFLSNLPIADYTRIQENLYRYKGFYLEQKTDRLYGNQAAAHLVGYIGEVTEKMLARDPYYKNGDLAGITGIERGYEKYLRGKKGVRTVLQDRFYTEKGSAEGGKFDSIAMAGPDIFSSIDLSLQQFGEQLLHGRIGSIVAIEPNTGEILALVNKPDYRPDLLIGPNRNKHFQELIRDQGKPLYNRAIRGVYPPGSTFKPVIALIGRQEQVLTPATTHGCAGGYRMGNLTVGCHPHGSPINLAQSLAISCNAYYCEVFRDIIDNPKYNSVRDGWTKMESYLNSFGLGTKMGIDIPGEVAGNIPSLAYLDKRHGKKWRSSTIISLAIGQGEILLTPLQMANVAAIIANRGYFYTPHAIHGIGPEKFKPEAFLVRHRVMVDTLYFESVIEGMADVMVPGGTAWNAAIPSLTICGKTGTSQNPHGEDHSLFIGFAPRNNPKIAIAVVVENAGYGATWAAPIATLMMEHFLKAEHEPSKAPHLLKKLLIMPGQNANNTQPKNP